MARNHVFVALCASALFAHAEARGGRRGRKWGGPRGGGAPEHMPAPRPVKFEFSEELDAASFERKIVRAANYSVKAEYYPLVMFHESWCKHCQATLPEFERGAEMVHKASLEGQLKGLAAPVKYFLLQCDRSLAERRVCDAHPGRGIPRLRLYRDQRQFDFFGERWAKNIAEWSVHIARPLLLQVNTKADMDKYGDLGGLFIMKSSVAKKEDNFQAWDNLAYEFIEYSFFCVASDSSEVAKSMPTDSGVTVYGKGFDPLPFKGQMREYTLRKWATYNQWPVVVLWTQDQARRIMEAGFDLVLYAYKAPNARFKGADAELDRYRAKAAEIRRTSKRKFLFARVDISAREHANWVSRVFPAVTVPSIFVLSGNISAREFVYWEDPTLDDAEELSLEALEDLMEDDWARQDETKWSTGKAWVKWIYRFGTGTVIGFVIVVFIPVFLCGLCGLCLRELMISDEEAPPALKVPGTQEANGAEGTKPPSAGTPITDPAQLQQILQAQQKAADQAQQKPSGERTDAARPDQGARQRRRRTGIRRLFM